ncbi:MAG: hypothetical protein NW200_09360 [Hyphomonadaceae bacterium]|nr:hypothetical protein [Hyphomonadaceae bacterium]
MSRRCAARRRRKDLLGLLLIFATVLALGGVGAAAMLLRTPAFDAATLCLTAGPPPAHTLILVDATDRLDVRHQRRLKAVALEEAARLPRWGRLTVLSLRPDAENAPRELFSGCTAGDRLSANPLWENVQTLEALKRERFDAPLAAALSSARGGRSADGSPIVEGLAAATADPAFAGPGRRIVLVSDLLQFSPGRFSLYAPGATWARYQAAPGALRAAPDLTDVAVRVVTLERKDEGPAQAVARQDFWAPYFDEAGAASVAWDR